MRRLILNALSSLIILASISSLSLPHAFSEELEYYEPDTSIIRNVAVSCEVCGEPVAETDTHKKSRRPLLDSSHEYVTYRFDSVARWIDGFFGDQRTDLESAHSFIRVRQNNTWQEGEPFHDSVSVRAKLRLPRLKERLNLIIADEQDDEDINQSNSIDDIARSESGNEEIALQYQAKKKKRHEVDYKLGLRSGTEVRLGARLRREWLSSGNILARVTETAYWQDTRGFGSRSVFDIDYVPSDDRLLRWSNRLDFTEDTLGTPWRSRLLYNTILDKKQGLAYYLQSEGETRPDYLTTSYGPGILYRINLFKRWLFFEVEPVYSWRRAEVEDSRKGVAAITARVEVVFSEKHKQPHYPVN